MYTLFITTHVTCVTVVLLSVRHFFIFLSLTLINSQAYYHRKACVPYVLTAVGLYAFDRLVRVVRTRHTRGWLTAEYSLNGGTTLVRVPSLRAGWRAGQHVRVRVVSGGWLAWMATWFLCRARPFTIAAGSGSGGVVLQIKALGSWTRNLLRVAGDAEEARPPRRPEQNSTDVERGRRSAREVRVIIEGPYGNY
jgi:predicted ferric reductase